jgi:anti-sigma factor RsiW
MNHPDDDRLLKLVLELLDADEESQLRDHLSQCDSCRARLERMQSETEVIGSIEPEIDGQAYPMPQTTRPKFVAWMKVAALLLVGFMAGYATSNSTRPTHVNVVPQQLKVKSPPEHVMLYTSCESVDTAVNMDWLGMRSQPDSLGA